MFIIFTKKHPVGINKGQCSNLLDQAAKEFLDEKYAKEISEEEYNEWAKAFKEDKEKLAQDLIDDSKKQAKSEKQSVLEDRISQLKDLKGFYNPKDLTVNTTQKEFVKINQQAKDAQEQSVEADKEHEKELAGKSIEELKEYIDENELEVELEDDATKEDIITLILLTKESKKKRTGVIGLFYKGYEYLSTIGLRRKSSNNTR